MKRIFIIGQNPVDAKKNSLQILGTCKAFDLCRLNEAFENKKLFLYYINSSDY